MTANELSTELYKAMSHKLREMGSIRMNGYNFASAIYATAVSLVSSRLNLPPEDVQDVFTALGISTEIKVEKEYNHD